MLPLVWFLAAWAVLIVIFGFLSLLTVSMMLRYGLSCFSTYVLSGLFLGVTMVVLFVTGSYLLGVDWTQSFSFTTDIPSLLQ